MRADLELLKAYAEFVNLWDRWDAAEPGEQAGLWADAMEKQREVIRSLENRQ